MGCITDLEKYIEELDQRVQDLDKDLYKKIVDASTYFEVKTKIEILKGISSDLKSILGIEEDE